MPNAPKRPCPQPNCPELITSTQPCPTHGKRKAYDVARGTAAERGYNYRWQKARKRFLDKHPLCKPCQEEGRVTAAFAVDHRIPHRQNTQLFWDESNWDPMCEAHHNAKARAERRD